MILSKAFTRVIMTLMALGVFQLSFSQQSIDPKLWQEAEKEIEELMDVGDIPGLSLIVIDGQQQVLKSYGQADLKDNQPVTEETLFQIGSCTKAFTALALTKLEKEGLVNLDDHVVDYIPWFDVVYEGTSVEISLRQLLHHTSGIPWHTISKIPASNDANSLETTVRALMNQELDELPGGKYQYATINYDVLAYIIQTVTKTPFEDYLQTAIIDELSLPHTSIGYAKDSSLMSEGHKIGFFSAREYDAPVYKGNNAAGYITSNAKDMAKWLRFQMGLSNNGLSELVPTTHERDKSVSLHNMSSYARGWEVALDGSGAIYHSGQNPNFTSHIVMRPEENRAVMIMANSNSKFTPFLAEKLMKIFSNEKIEREFKPGDGNDKVFSGISLVLVIYTLIVLAFIAMVLVQAIKGKRSYEKMTLKTFWNYLGSFLLAVPFLYGLYILPQSMAGFNWEAMVVWSPISLVSLIGGILVAIAVSYVAYFISLLFPENNKYKKKAPIILLVSILSGLSNVAVIVMVTSSVDSNLDLQYLIFYYALIVSMYLFGRRFVQVNLIKYTRGLVYDLRIKLIDKVFSTSYQKFEKINRGRVYTAFNDDVNTIGQSTNLFVTLITSIITAIGAFIYLAAIAFWATLLTIFLIVAISTLYYFATKSTNVYFKKARDSRDVFMKLINGLIDGFKEISLQRNKKLEYKEDVADSANEFREKTSTADIRFVNAFLVGESLLVVLLGVVSIGMSEMFPNIKIYTIMSFVIVLLYLMGPINAILGAVPALVNLKIAWNRVNAFIKEIPANLDLKKFSFIRHPHVNLLEVQDMSFKFDGAENKNFGIGPVNFRVSSGEVVFIIGGNGSGKTTFAKLLTGLYTPDEGQIMINGEKLEGHEVSEHFSTVFSPCYLFEKLYNLNTDEKQEEIKKYLKLLDLEHKVKIENNKYSSINLSSGQRKRLALLQCYLEDSPIYLFDEWAADQDPGYRKFFYRTLLPEMRKQGKVVIAITHDDHYFDVADRIYKMENGQLKDYAHETALDSVLS